jgi:hypothetical protein
MSEPTPNTADATPRRQRFRFGLRGLLVAVSLLGLALGLVAREHHRAEERTALVAELARAGVRPLLEEPTGVALLVRKFLPRREAWVRDRIGKGWFSRPTVFACSRLGDEHVPYAIERLRRLGTVREIHFRGRRLTEQGVSELRDGLPGVGVVPSNNRALHRYFNDQVGHEHLATEALALLALLAAGLLGILAIITWPLVRRRRPRRVAD